MGRCPKCGGQLAWEHLSDYPESFNHCEKCGAWYHDEREVEEPEEAGSGAYADKYVWHERSQVFHDRMCCRLYNVRTGGCRWHESGRAPRARRPCKYCLPDGIPEDEWQPAVLYIT